MVPGSSRPSASLGIRLMAAGRPRQSTLPMWLEAMLESPVAGHDARRMLSSSGMSAGSLWDVPAWEPTPAQRAEREAFQSPRAIQVDGGGIGAPSSRPKLP
jgi:hypothetical protein